MFFYVHHVCVCASFSVFLMAQFKNTGLLGKSAAADNIQQLPSPLSNRILPSAQLFPLITFFLSLLI